MCKSCKKIILRKVAFVLDFKYFFCKECKNKGKIEKFIEKKDGVPFEYTDTVWIK